MVDADSRPHAAAPSGVSPEKATLIGTLAHLWPYIWPGDRADLKMRVVWSMVLLLVAKLATLQTTRIDRALEEIGPAGAETVRRFLLAMIDRDDPDKVLETIFSTASAKE